MEENLGSVRSVDLTSLAAICGSFLFPGPSAVPPGELANGNGSLYHTEFGGLIHFSCKS